MKSVITITKNEVEEAVRAYIDDRISAGYRFTFKPGTLSFRNKDGDIGYFECDLEVAVEPKESE